MGVIRFDDDDDDPGLDVFSLQWFSEEIIVLLGRVITFNRECCDFRSVSDLELWNCHIVCDMLNSCISVSSNELDSIEDLTPPDLASAMLIGVKAAEWIFEDFGLRDAAIDVGILKKADEFTGEADESLVALQMSKFSGTLLVKTNTETDHDPDPKNHFFLRVWLGSDSVEQRIFESVARFTEVSQYRVGQLQDAVQAGLACLKLEPPSQSNESTKPKPNWDPERSELTLSGQVIRKISPRADNLLKIVQDFQQFGWPHKIDSPFLPGEFQKRNEAIRELNKRLTRIRFKADGSGEAITWDFLTPQNKVAANTAEIPF